MEEEKDSSASGNTAFRITRDLKLLLNKKHLGVYECARSQEEDNATTVAGVAWMLLHQITNLNAASKRLVEVS